MQRLYSDAAVFATLRECFAHADHNQKGYLDLRDLKCGVAAALGIRASKLVLAQLFHDIVPDATHGGIECIRVDVDTFTHVLSERLHRTELLDNVRRTFKALDTRAQGFITFDCFREACALVLPHASSTTHVQLSAFYEADRDGDGRVTYQDFERMYLLAHGRMATAAGARR